MNIGTDKRKIEVDPEGFLEDSAIWDEDVARYIAQHEKIELNDEKMKIVSFLRAHFAKHHSFPILKSVCKRAGSKSADCFTEEFVDPMKAWKIAGLPKPPNIFYNSFDGKKYTPNPFY